MTAVLAIVVLNLLIAVWVLLGRLDELDDPARFIRLGMRGGALVLLAVAGMLVALLIWIVERLEAKATAAEDLQEMEDATIGRPDWPRR